MPHFSIKSILKVCTEEKICSYPVPCSFRTWPIKVGGGGGVGGGRGGRNLDQISRKVKSRIAIVFFVLFFQETKLTV